MTKELAPQYDAFQLGDVLAKSGYFSDASDTAKAVVKVLAGRELGIGPIASMTGIYVIQGKISLSANLLAGLVKRDPDYDYKVKALGDTDCIIDFYRGPNKIGTSGFNLDDAKKAGTKNLDRYPRNMLFARAMTNGFRWFTPHLAGLAPVYTPEELGAEIDEDGEVVSLPTAAEVVDEEKTVIIEPDGGRSIGEDGVGKLKAWADEHDYAWPHIINKANKMFQDKTQFQETGIKSDQDLEFLTLDQAHDLVAALVDKHPNGSNNRKPHEVDRPEGGATEILTALNVATNLDTFLGDGFDKEDLYAVLLDAKGLTEDEVKAYMDSIKPMDGGRMVHPKTFAKTMRSLAKRVIELQDQPQEATQ